MSEAAAENVEDTTETSMDIKEEAEGSQAASSSADCGDQSVDASSEVTEDDNRVPPTEDRPGDGGGPPKETVDFKIVYNKQKHDVTFPLDDTVGSLKSQIEKLTGVPAAMQKIMFKGRMKDEDTLREQKVIKGSKIMVVGSTVTDLLSVAAPDPKVLKEEEKAAASASKEPLSTQKPHKTVLDKHGKPDDLVVGMRNVREPLPPHPISGMYNKSGGKVRLTFKLDQDQLWLGTKERTEKLPLGSIKAVVSEAIEGHEDYHIVGLQLGPTEASRYWVYWVPAQYVDAIKDSVLGKWQYF